MQPATIDDLASRGRRKVANCRKTACRDADIARTLAVLIDNGSALEDQIVRGRDGSLLQSKSSRLRDAARNRIRRAALAPPRSSHLMPRSARPGLAKT
jgi:hypothetical protein